MADLSELVNRNDLDELVREVDRRTERGDWDGLVEVRDLCLAALDRGFQLWPAASLAEYRLALRAPGPWTGAVIGAASGRFVLGPLTEVAASTHTWAELAPHLDPGPSLTYVAHERVVRGEDLTAEHRVDDKVVALPSVLQAWEPTYTVATYHDDRAEFPRPPLPPLHALDVAHARARPLPGDEGSRALAELVAHWASESGAAVTAAVFEGSAEGAITHGGDAVAARLTGADALAQLAWAGASGAGHGRRRGMAAGRVGAWWALERLAGMEPDDHVDPDGLGDALSELSWWVWDDRDADPAEGWRLRLAVDDPADGLAWLIDAVDVPDPGEAADRVWPR